MPKGIYKRTKQYRKNLGKAMSKALSGRELSEEHKKKIRLTLKGRKISMEWREKISMGLKRAYREGKRVGFVEGNIPWNKGAPHSKETKRKMSENHTDFKGENNPYWKDGRSKNKEYIVWIKNKRNREKRSAEGSHSFQEWEELKKKYDYICLGCNKNEPEIQLTEDHIVPLSKGGSDYIDNIQPLCRSCNCKKHNKIINYIASNSFEEKEYTKTWKHIA